MTRFDNLPASSKARAFYNLHINNAPFVIPNPWDTGSARLLEGLGFQALATTSSGFAMTKGYTDYNVTQDDAIRHGGDIAASVDIPVSADLENGFGKTPEDVAATIQHATQTALAGGSIEDYSGDKNAPILDKTFAVERIAAAVETARDAQHGFVLTARAESFLHGISDLDDVIWRLQAFEKAGADVVYAPGLPDMDAVKAVCSAVSIPVNVLALFGLRNHTLEEFKQAGVARVSIGGGLAWQAYGTLARSAKHLLGTGTFNFLDQDAVEASTIAPLLRQL